MIFHSPNLNETSASPYSDHSERNPQVAPVRWEEICSKINSLQTSDFDEIAVQLHDNHEDMKDRIKDIIGRLLDFKPQKKTNQMPLTSIGPSGLGGEYQHERY